MNNFSNGSVEYFCGVVVEAEADVDVGVIETHVSPSSSLKKIPPLANLEQTFFAPLSKLSIEQIHSNSPKYKIQTRPKWNSQNSQVVKLFIQARGFEPRLVGLASTNRPREPLRRPLREIDHFTAL